MHAPLIRTLSFLSAIALGLTLLTATAPPAQAGPDMTRPFTREPVQRGDVDVDQYNIEHVYEVQIRLRRLGYLAAQPNGTFGPKTERAVKRFQRSRGLRVTGRVDAKTWKPLILRSTFGKAAARAACAGPGWHVCYDRKRHQASLFLNGRMHNSWLVRGGAYNSQTRTGDFTVQWRSKDHRSRTFGGAPMPYAQFFSGGQALHGSRVMMNPYEGHSHGCVNFWVEDARQLWNLTFDKRLQVHVYGAWD
ncbi:MAG TPA: L,D-transpeptidase family protein [Nocardioidaceae bacterium]|nr:L,D-transpeptidase family protein [Nocardioidaceae bacterium]